MTTWTQEQISQARGIRSKVFLDQAAVARHGVDSVIRDKMWKRMNDIAHSFALELHPDDIRFGETEVDDVVAGVEVRSWWEPPTTEIELRGGGEHDGTRGDWHGAPDLPLFVPEPPRIDRRTLHDPPDTEALPAPLKYVCTGWSETGRRWVYSPR